MDVYRLVYNSGTLLVCHNPQCHPAAFNRKMEKKKKWTTEKERKKKKETEHDSGRHLVIIDDLHYHFLGHADEAEDWQAPAAAPHPLSAHHLHYHGSCLYPRPIPRGSEMAEASG